MIDMILDPNQKVAFQANQFFPRRASADNLKIEKKENLINY